MPDSVNVFSLASMPKYDFEFHPGRDVAGLESSTHPDSIDVEIVCRHDMGMFLKIKQQVTLT